MILEKHEAVKALRGIPHCVSSANVPPSSVRMYLCEACQVSPQTVLGAKIQRVTKQGTPLNMDFLVF